jgi:AcrR family transcriptional regulator
MRTDKQAKILAAARDAFLRYGYKRVNMGDIAVAAGISRPALYLVFNSKEDVFRGVFDTWVDATLAQIEGELPSLRAPRAKLLLIFELWAVRPFEMVLQSAEAKELLECSFDFARESLETGYARLEAVLVPIIRPLLKRQSDKAGPTAEQAAHVLTGAVRGFKQVAASAAELRTLISDLLALWLD